MSCGDAAAETLAGLDAWIAGHEGELVDVVSRLVRVPSVGEPFDPKAAQPFGPGCAAVIDATRDLVEGYDLAWENHAYYAMEARLPRALIGAHAGDARDTGPQAAGTVPDHAAKAGDIAFFSHLDVVPAGSQGWSADPFSPYVHDGWLFGRGSSDNKGPFSAVLFALRYLREKDVPLRHDVVLYGGCDEERGMEDVKYLVPRIPKPAASLVSDAYFPVCYSEKGIASFDLTRRFDDGSLIAFEGGASHNTVPDRAAFAVRGESGLARETVEGRAAHAAFPQQGVNAVALAAARAAQVEGASPQVREAMAFIARLRELRRLGARRRAARCRAGRHDVRGNRRPLRRRGAERAREHALSRQRDGTGAARPRRKRGRRCGLFAAGGRPKRRIRYRRVIAAGRSADGHREQSAGHAA